MIIPIIHLRCDHGTSQAFHKNNILSSLSRFSILTVASIKSRCLTQSPRAGKPEIPTSRGKTCIVPTDRPCVESIDKSRGTCRSRVAAAGSLEIAARDLDNSLRGTRRPLSSTGGKRDFPTAWRERRGGVEGA